MECGAFVGYTALRMARQVELDYAARGASQPGFRAHSRLQGSPRVVTMEIDPIHACITRHMLDLGRLSHVAECWIGQVKDLLPRVLEESGHFTVNMVFMDQRGTTFHDDLAQLEVLREMAPGCRVVADNCVKPGAPLHVWHAWYSDCYSTVNVSLNEFLETTIEDWQVVCDYAKPAAVPDEWELVT